jgi:hypothetical protein
MSKVGIKHVRLELVFDIWDNEVSVDEVGDIISRAVDRAGYALNDDPKVVSVVEEEIEC